MSGLTTRILKERERLLKEKVEGIRVALDENNNRYFFAIIDGPKDSPYEGGFFKLQMFIPEDYPTSPPKCLFMTKIYHPNIDQIGRICLDVLSKQWSPATQIRSVLLSIQALISSPNPDDPLANDVAEIWKKDTTKAVQTAKEWTQKYATKSALGDTSNFV